MKQVKEIEFVFENCECLKIPRNAIGTFYIESIHPVIARIASNSISKYWVADTFVIEIFKEADIEYNPFGIAEEKSTKLKRLSEYNDITSVEIIFEDDSVEQYLIHYDEGEDEGKLGAANVNQKIYLSDLGNLYIVIDKEKTIEDCFSMEEINSPEAVAFSKDMLDIGIKEEPEHEYREDDLPEMYRYVYLSTERNSSLAIRVFDKTCGWKFVFEDPQNAIHFPTTWQYPKSNIVEFLDRTNEDFTVEKIKEIYPPQ